MHVASPLIIERFKQHRDFCLSRKYFDENFQAILAFDIETRRIFFNMKTFFTEDAYKRRWEEIPLKVARQKSDEASAKPNREAARIAVLISRLEGSNSNVTTRTANYRFAVFLAELTLKYFCPRH